MRAGEAGQGDGGVRLRAAVGLERLQLAGQGSVQAAAQPQRGSPLASRSVI